MCTCAVHCARTRRAESGKRHYDACFRRSLYGEFVDGSLGRTALGCVRVYLPRTNTTTGKRRKMLQAFFSLLESNAEQLHTVKPHRRR